MTYAASGMGTEMRQEHDVLNGDLLLDATSAEELWSKRMPAMFSFLTGQTGFNKQVRDYLVVVMQVSGGFRLDPYHPRIFAVCQPYAASVFYPIIRENHNNNFIHAGVWILLYVNRGTASKSSWGQNFENITEF